MLRKSQILFVTALMLISICGTTFAATTTATPAATGVVNLNTADIAQLSYLPRVGAKAAQRILDYRKEHGAFHKTTDLMQVKGFGEKRFESISAYLAVDGKTTLSAKVHSPRKPRKARQAATPAS